MAALRISGYKLCRVKAYEADEEVLTLESFYPETLLSPLLSVFLSRSVSYPGGVLFSIRP